MSFFTERSGGHPDGNGLLRRPSAVKVLLAANVFVFFLQMALGDTLPGQLGWLSAHFGLSREGLASGQIWQILTYMFLHGSLFHIIANLLIIWFAGSQLESMIGRRRFLTLYFTGGLLGGIGQLLTMPVGVVIGASAAGFAVLIAFTTIHPERQITLLLFFVLPLRLKAKFLAYGAVAVSLFFVIVPPGDGIGHLAHLVGCVVGYVFARQWGFGSPTPLERLRAGSHRSAHHRDKHPPTPDFMRAEIDPILDKISKHGMHSLTPSERDLLEQGRRHLASGDNNQKS